MHQYNAHIHTSYMSQGRFMCEYQTHTHIHTSQHTPPQLLNDKIMYTGQIHTHLTQLALNTLPHTHQYNVS